MSQTQSGSQPKYLAALLLKDWRVTVDADVYPYLPLAQVQGGVVVMNSLETGFLTI